MSSSSRCGRLSVSSSRSNQSVRGNVLSWDELPSKSTSHNVQCRDLLPRVVVEKLSPVVIQSYCSPKSEMIQLTCEDINKNTTFISGRKDIAEVYTDSKFSQVSSVKRRKRSYRTFSRSSSCSSTPSTSTTSTNSSSSSSPSPCSASNESEKDDSLNSKLPSKLPFSAVNISKQPLVSRREPSFKSDTLPQTSCSSKFGKINQNLVESNPFNVNHKFQTFSDSTSLEDPKLVQPSFMPAEPHRLVSSKTKCLPNGNTILPTEPVKMRKPLNIPHSAIPMKKKNNTSSTLDVTETGSFVGKIPSECNRNLKKLQVKGSSTTEQNTSSLNRNILASTSTNKLSKRISVKEYNSRNSNVLNKVFSMNSMKRTASSFQEYKIPRVNETDNFRVPAALSTSKNKEEDDDEDDVLSLFAESADLTSIGDNGFKVPGTFRNNNLFSKQKSIPGLERSKTGQPNDQYRSDKPRPVDKFSRNSFSCYAAQNQETYRDNRPSKPTSNSNDCDSSSVNKNDTRQLNRTAAYVSEMTKRHYKNFTENSNDHSEQYQFDRTISEPLSTSNINPTSSNSTKEVSNFDRRPDSNFINNRTINGEDPDQVDERNNADEGILDRNYSDSNDRIHFYMTGNRFNPEKEQPALNFVERLNRNQREMICEPQYDLPMKRVFGDDAAESSDKYEHESPISQDYDQHNKRFCGDEAVESSSSSDDESTRRLTSERLVNNTYNCVAVEPPSSRLGELTNLHKYDRRMNRLRNDEANGPSSFKVTNRELQNIQTMSSEGIKMRQEDMIKEQLFNGKICDHFLRNSCSDYKCYYSHLIPQDIVRKAIEHVYKDAVCNIFCKYVDNSRGLEYRFFTSLVEYFEKMNNMDYTLKLCRLLTTIEVQVFKKQMLYKRIVHSVETQRSVDYESAVAFILEKVYLNNEYDFKTINEFINACKDKILQTKMWSVVSVLKQKHKYYLPLHYLECIVRNCLDQDKTNPELCKEVYEYIKSKVPGRLAMKLQRYDELEQKFNLLTKVVNESTSNNEENQLTVLKRVSYESPAPGRVTDISKPVEDGSYRRIENRFAQSKLHSLSERVATNNRFHSENRIDYERFCQLIKDKNKDDVLNMVTSLPDLKSIYKAAESYLTTTNKSSVTFRELLLFVTANPSTHRNTKINKFLCTISWRIILAHMENDQWTEAYQTYCLMRKASLEFLDENLHVSLSGEKLSPAKRAIAIFEICVRNRRYQECVAIIHLHHFYQSPEHWKLKSVPEDKDLMDQLIGDLIEVLISNIENRPTAKRAVALFETIVHAVHGRSLTEFQSQLVKLSIQNLLDALMKLELYEDAFKVYKKLSDRTTVVANVLSNVIYRCIVIIACLYSPADVAYIGQLYDEALYNDVYPKFKVTDQKVNIHSNWHSKELELYFKKIFDELCKAFLESNQINEPFNIFIQERVPEYNSPPLLVWETSVENCILEIRKIFMTFNPRIRILKICTINKIVRPDRNDFFNYIKVNTGKSDPRTFPRL